MQPIMAGNPSLNNNNNSIRAPSHQHQQQQQLQFPLFPSPSFFPFHQFDYKIPATSYNPPPHLPSSTSTASTTTTTTSSSPTTSSSSSGVTFSPSSSSYHDNQPQLALQLPDQPWSQLLLGGLSGGVDPAAAKTTGGLNQVILPDMINSSSSTSTDNIYLGDGDHHHHHHHGQHDSQGFQQKPRLAAVHDQYHEINMFPAAVHGSIFTQDHDLHQSSSITTAFNPSFLQCSTNKSDPTMEPSPRHQSTNCPSQLQSNNSTTANAGVVQKKARVEPSSTQSSFKLVRKERMGDKIAVLHQLVSPYGKTDTASVLLEAIGYIRFLQSQIEALSLLYMNSGSELNQGCSDEEANKDLRSRGLCLVPLSSCTTHADHNNNGADLWSPALRQQ